MSGPSTFEDRWVVVSGASSGIGRAIVIELVAQQARVVMLGRNVERLEETARLAGPPDRTVYRQIDLSQTSAILAVIRTLVSETGRLYGLCHAAGQGMTLPLAATKPDRARRLMDINFLAGLELSRAIAERTTLDESGGSITWISSVYAHVGAPGQIAYCATKSAIIGAVRAMAAELASRHIRVNSVSPGLVRTEMTNAGQMSTEQWDEIAARHPLGVGDPQNVARAAAFLLHPASRWITGTDLVIDGGYLLQ